MSVQDEFSFIESITPKKTHHSNLQTGIGDDAALFSGNSDVEEIICMDTMIEEIHFTRETMSPFHIGYKALASNISDIAAMGGKPTFYLVSIAIPQTWSETELLDIYKGMKILADQYKMDLIGGDTVASTRSLVITITVLGRIQKGRKLLRQNARANDIVFVTGSLGDSAAGLQLLLKHGRNYNFSEFESYLVQRHQQPEPRVKVGEILAKFPRVALNDVSDGIASELNEIAAASNVTIIIDPNQLPTSDSICRYPTEDQRQWVLNGGEDYELVGTVPEQDWLEIEEQCKKGSHRITKIGYVTEGPAGVFLEEARQLAQLPKCGFNHFEK